MHRGYVKLWRRVEDSKTWSRGLEYRGLLITLIERANHKTGFFLGERIERGQFACSVSALAKELKISRSKLIRMLNVLKSDNIADIKANNQFTVITIINYGRYQDSNEDDRTASDTTSRTTTGQRPDNDRTLSKNDKNEKKFKHARVIEVLVEWSQKVGAPLSLPEIRKWQGKIRELELTGITAADQASALERMRDESAKFPNPNWWADTFRQAKESQRQSSSSVGSAYKILQDAQKRDQEGAAGWDYEALIKKAEAAKRGAE